MAAFLNMRTMNEWEDTKHTLHLWVQIVGKLQLMHVPACNHWWHMTLLVCPVGLTTHSIPYNNRNDQCSITFDFINHELSVQFSDGLPEQFDLHDGLSVADFESKLFSILNSKGINTNILNHPFDLKPARTEFSEIKAYNSYDKGAVQSYFKTLRWVDSVFKEFSGQFFGKQCPVHLYWHHFDLTVTRFSGKKAPPMDAEKSAVEKDAYSHEVISFGFWPGDEHVREAAFYSYTYPEPDGINKERLLPDAAKWVDQNNSAMAFLYLSDLKVSADPTQSLLGFLQSAYKAGAEKARWPIDDLKYIPFA